MLTEKKCYRNFVDGFFFYDIKIPISNFKGATSLFTRALDRTQAITLVFSPFPPSATFKFCHPNHRGANTFSSTEDSEEHEASVCL